MAALLVYVAAAGAADCPAVLDFYQRPLLGDQPVYMCEEFSGRVVLIVNTASKCGFTPQYDGLEEIYARYRRGLAPLVVPFTLLQHHFRRNPNPYISRQVNLNPHPRELMLRNVL